MKKRAPKHWCFSISFVTFTSTLVYNIVQNQSIPQCQKNNIQLNQWDYCRKFIYQLELKLCKHLTFGYMLDCIMETREKLCILCINMIKYQERTREITYQKLLYYNIVPQWMLLNLLWEEFLRLFLRQQDILNR